MKTAEIVPVEPSNPFPVAIRESQTASGDTANSRAIAEAQGAMVIAKKFPRDKREAFERIKNACARPALAEGALYAYSKGGANITGPSIRLAEVLAQEWGNIQFGVRELEQRDGESTVEAFAWDMETNTRQIKEFQVKHERTARGVITKLKDSRDIYETVANQGSRRLRACILGVIPGDVIEAAVTACEATLKSKVEVTPDLIKTLLAKFEEFKVTKEMVEKKIQRKMEAMLPAQVLNLRKIYNSMKDGMSTAQDWFEVTHEVESQAKPAIGNKE